MPVYLLALAEAGISPRITPCQDSFRISPIGDTSSNYPMLENLLELLHAGISLRISPSRDTSSNYPMPGYLFYLPHVGILTLINPYQDIYSNYTISEIPLQFSPRRDTSQDNLMTTSFHILSNSLSLIIPPLQATSQGN